MTALRSIPHEFVEKSRNHSFCESLSAVLIIKTVSFVAMKIISLLAYQVYPQLNYACLSTTKLQLSFKVNFVSKEEIWKTGNCYLKAP